MLASNVGVFSALLWKGTDTEWMLDWNTNVEVIICSERNMNIIFKLHLNCNFLAQKVKNLITVEKHLVGWINWRSRKKIVKGTIWPSHTYMSQQKGIPLFGLFLLSGASHIVIFCFWRCTIICLDKVVPLLICLDKGVPLLAYIPTLFSDFSGYFLYYWVIFFGFLTT